MPHVYFFEDKILPSLDWLKYIALYPDILRMVLTKRIFQDVAIKLSCDAKHYICSALLVKSDYNTRFLNTKFKGFFIGLSGKCSGKN